MRTVSLTTRNMEGRQIHYRPIRYAGGDDEPEAHPLYRRSRCLSATVKGQSTATESHQWIAFPVRSVFLTPPCREWKSGKLGILALPNCAAIDFETADHGRDGVCSIGGVLEEDGRMMERNHRMIRPPRVEFFLP